MSKAVISRLQPVPTNADEWIARLRASDVSAEDRLAFQAWLDEDRAHPIEFERSNSIGRMADAIEAVPEMAGSFGHRL